MTSRPADSKAALASRISHRPDGRLSPLTVTAPGSKFAASACENRSAAFASRLSPTIPRTPEILTINASAMLFNSKPVNTSAVNSHLTSSAVLLTGFLPAKSAPQPPAHVPGLAAD